MKKILLLLALPFILIASAIGITVMSQLIFGSEKIEGRVLDQDNKPVGGAKVKLREFGRVLLIPIPFGPSVALENEKVAVSKSDGTFAFWKKYEWFECKNIEKTAYLSDGWNRPQTQTFPDHRFSGVTYRLYKINNEIVPLYTSGWIELDTDGTEVFYDLDSNWLSSEINSSCELGISINKSFSALEYYPLVIRATNGGVFFCTNEMPYAPAQGYIKGVAFNSRFGRKNNVFPFFYRSRNGDQYARVWLELRKDKKAFRLKYVQNSSRYLYNAQLRDNANLNYYYEIDYASPDDVLWWKKFTYDRVVIVENEEFFVSTWEKIRNPRKVFRKDMGRAIEIDFARSAKFLFVYNPLTPDQVFNSLASDRNSHVRRKLLFNPNLKPEILNALKNDKDKNIASMAKTYTIDPKKQDEWIRLKRYLRDRL